MPIYKTKKSKDGKQGYRVVANFTDASGKYQKKTKIVYGAAEAKLAEMELLKSTETAFSASKTVQQLYEEYVSSHQNEVRLTSLEKAKEVLNGHILPYFGKTKLNKLTPSKLQEWKNLISEKGYKVRTNQNIYSTFHAMLNYAVKMDYLSVNPLSKLGNFKEVYFEKPQDKLHYYTPEQFRAYIRVAKNYTETLYDNAFYVFFCIAYYTGMRKGEINALQWCSVNGNIISVRRSLAQKVKGVQAIITPPKTKKSYRDIQIPTALVDILNEHKKRQMQHPAFTDEFLVCGGDFRLSDSTISNRNVKYAIEAGLPHIAVHDFRHSHASLLANNGINIMEISRRLGHRNVQLTWNTYSHLYPEEEERAVSVLEQV